MKLEYDEYSKISNEDLYDLIVSNLDVSEYALNVKFKGKKKAEYLESILYICPKCKKMHTITTKGDYIECSNCGLKVKYNENLLLTSDDSIFSFKYINEWYDYQIDVVKNKEIGEELIYSDNIEMYEPKMNEKREFIGKGKMTLYKDYFLIDLEESLLKLDYDDIYVVTLLGRMKMNIYYKDKVYQVFNDRHTNLIKYMHMFYILKNRKEGIEDGFIGI